MNKILEEFGAVRPNNFYVTDNGANIKAAFHDQVWQGCCGHNINLAVSHTLQRKTSKHETEAVLDDEVAEICTLVNVCKDIVTRVKRTQLQHELTTTLKQSVATRWNSTLFMMQSVADNLEQLKSTPDRTQQKLLLDQDEELLKEAVKVLKHLDVAIRLLSSDQMPTLHLVVPVRHNLITNLMVADDDSEAIKGLKSMLIQQLDTYYVINDLHDIAAILDPRLKHNNSVIPADRRDVALNSICRMMAEVPTSLEEETKSSMKGSVTSVTDSERLPAKKARLETRTSETRSFFGDLYQFSSAATSQDELDIYMECPDVSENVLHFWSSIGHMWPKLASVVRVILAIPATETSSERVFSTAGRILEERRTQLKGDSVDNLMFLHGLKSQRIQ